LCLGCKRQSWGTSESFPELLIRDWYSYPEVKKEELFLERNKYCTAERPG
jgi:hypothetical protein